MEELKKQDKQTLQFIKKLDIIRFYDQLIKDIEEKRYEKIEMGMATYSKDRIEIDVALQQKPTK